MTQPPACLIAREHRTLAPRDTNCRNPIESTESRLRIAFIDDSGQNDPPRDGLGPLVSLGAVIFPEHTVDAFHRRLDELRASIGMPTNEEIKWNPPKCSFLANAGGEVVTALRRSMLELAADCEVKSIVCIIDHGCRYQSRDIVGVGQELLKWLFERYTIFLEKDESLGIMIADKPGGGSAEEAHFLANTLIITGGGTEYVKPGAVVMPVLTSDSKHLPHLQLADLVVAATTAAVAGRGSGIALKDQLRALAHRQALGDINGAGLVLFPDYMNLYHWALGEATWSKASALSGWSLPRQGQPWAEDDGLGGDVI
ncbi:DUF3800 domain-containing protein [Pseudonocardia sp. NPDC046786]|uniref:DUF3800 domain-containing protein n=1 Tax=Pseudonocardia sp. NPDC046786 TaxID=3155471 RepID=UPI0033DADEC8